MDTRHSIIYAKNLKTAGNFKPVAGEFIIFDKPNSDALLLGKSLPFFDLLNQKERIYMLKKATSEFKKQINQFTIDQKNHPAFCAGILCKDEIYLTYSENCVLWLCKVAKNKKVTFTEANDCLQNITDWQNLKMAVYKISEPASNEVFLILSVNSKKDALSIKEKLMNVINMSLSSVREKELSFSQKLRTQLNASTMITKLETRNEAKVMTIMEGFGDIGKGVENLYLALLNRTISFVFECQQIIKDVEEFLMDVWNLAILQSSIKTNGMNFIFNFNYKKMMIQGDEFKLPLGIADILNYIHIQYKRPIAERDLSIMMLEKIKAKVIKEALPILSRVKKVSDLALIKDPCHKFYAALYLALKEIEPLALNINQFENTFFNEHISAIFRPIKNQMPMANVNPYRY